jgi:hypothetical protein
VPRHIANVAGCGIVTGGVAKIIYGEPRFTRDIDLVLAISPAEARRFLHAWAFDHIQWLDVQDLESPSPR